MRCIHINFLNNVNLIDPIMNKNKQRTEAVQDWFHKQIQDTKQKLH